MKTKIKFVKKLKWGKFVSPASDRKLAPYNWYAFKHRFGSELVSNIFNLFELKENSCIFDPFCGGGTTLIKAKMDGYDSSGLDISPFSVFLSQVLTTKHDPKELKYALKKINHDSTKKVEIPDVGILFKSFSDQTLRYIYSLRDSIISLNSPERDFFLLSLLSILNKVSKSKKSGGFLRITNQRKVSKYATRNLFESESSRLMNSISLFNFAPVTSKAVLGDARNYPLEIKTKKFDAILTSPPYPNRHDYTRIYELELLVGFIFDNNSLKSLRYDTLRSHVEARKKYESQGYAVPQLLEDRINILRHRKMNNSKIVSTLYGYFEDMYLSLKEMAQVVKNGGRIGLVVSNVRFSGVAMPVDEILGSIGEQVGLKLNAIYVLRYRGNSSQQMLEYKRVPNRESLIVFQK